MRGTSSSENSVTPVSASGLGFGRHAQRIAQADHDLARRAAAADRPAPACGIGAQRADLQQAIGGQGLGARDDLGTLFGVLRVGKAGRQAGPRFDPHFPAQPSPAGATEAGTRATRRSPGNVSLTAATIMGDFNSSAGRALGSPQRLWQNCAALESARSLRRRSRSAVRGRRKPIDVHYLQRSIVGVRRLEHLAASR